MKKVVFGVLSILGLSLVAPHIARAEPSAPTASDRVDDEVTLKDGGALRGVVVSVEPGKEVKILVPGDKDARVLPWSQVADVQRGKYAKKSTVEAGSAGEGYGDAPPPRKPTTTPDDGGSLDPNRLHVHIESPEPAELKHVTAISDGLINGHYFVVTSVESVCQSPCDADIPIEPGGSYYIDGKYPRSGTFSFATHGKDAVVDVKPGSTGRRVGGWLGLTLGPAVALGGSLPLVFKSISCSAGCSREEADDMMPEALGGSFITLGVGGFISGIVLFATSGTTATPRAADEPAVGVWVGAPRETRAALIPPVSPISGPTVLGVQGAF